MRYNIEERIKEEAKYIVRTGATVRTTAKVFGISKTTIHKDMTQKLHMINFNLYLSVASILNNNLNERAIRGGAATKKKYLKN